MSWRPATLLESPDDVHTFESDRHGQRYRCPNCGVFRPRGVIVDVRALPIPEDWACDCCWSAWERAGRIVDSGPPIVVTKRRAHAMEWRRRWVIAHGALADVARKFDAGGKL